MGRANKIIIGAIIAVLLATFVLLAYYIYGEKNETAGPQYVFSYAENQQSDYPTTLGAVRFAELVFERTEGRIEILVKDKGEMGTETDVLEQMKYGGVDFSRVSLSQIAAYAPEMNVLQMPYLYISSEHMWSVLDGEIGDRYLNNISDDDFVGLSWYDAGCRNFYTTEMVTSIEGLQGKRIRIQDSSLMADMVSALGATPVPMDYHEVYAALETRSVAGAENNWPSYESMQHYEVAKYIMLDEHTRVPEMQICSARTWEKLSDEDKAIIKECALESAIYERQLWSEREQKSREIAQAAGVTVTEISQEEKREFQAAMADVYEKYCADDYETLEQIMGIEEKEALSE